jgi:hypothetical protein
VFFLGRFASHLPIALLLAACAQSETRSVVSADDLPASKYHNVAIFIENVDESQAATAAQMVISTFRNSGVNARSGSDAFEGRSKLTEVAKAKIIQSEFDAVLYLTVVQEGLTEELVPDAHSDGQVITFYKNLGIMGASFTTDIGVENFIVKPDGSVYQPKLALQTKVDLQDTKTAKLVWTSETIASGPAKLTDMNTLFEQASRQIVEKMRADNAI